MRKSLITVATLLSCVFLHGQNAEFEYFLSTNPLLGSGNAAALCTSPLKSISSATASFNKDNGAFVGIDGSSDSWQAGVRGESFTRISDRIVFCGGLSYSYFSGKNMGGSALVDRESNPVAFLESTSETLGGKTRERYGLDAGMSYSLSEKWSLGFKLGYSAGNNVKVKDPRYRSELMFLDMSAGFFYRGDRNFAFGASAIFKNTQEIIKSHLFGTTDKSYYLLIDRGSFFGTLEQVEGMNGFVSTSDFQPMTNNLYGASFQLEAGSKVRSYNGITVLYRGGHYGKGSSTYPIYFEYSGFTAEYDGKLLWGSRAFSHDLHYGADFAMLGTKENSIKYTTPVGGTTIAQIIGSNDVQSRMDIHANAGYKLAVDVQGNRPRMEMGVDISAYSQNRKTTIYPYYRKSNVSTVEADVFYRQSFTAGKNVFTVGAGALYGMGFGVAAEDGQLASTSGASKLVSQDEYLAREFEYNTISRVGAGLSFTYTRMLKGNSSLFLRISDDFTRALKQPEHILSPNRNCAVFTIGCTL